MKRIVIAKYLPTLFAAVWLLVSAGCASKGEFGGRTAVVIYNEQADAILDAASKEFVSKGFGVAKREKDTAVYERAGTAVQNAAYGTWMGGTMWERATVTVEPYARGAHLLAVQVSLLQNKDDEFFKEEHKMSRRARKPFQEMLDRIASDLSGVPLAPDAN